MRVLFLGSTSLNSGPGNANKAFVRYWPEDDDVVTIESANKIGRILEGVREGMASDVVLSTASDWPDVITHFVLGVFGKPHVWALGNPVLTVGSEY